MLVEKAIIIWESEKQEDIDVSQLSVKYFMQEIYLIPFYRAKSSTKYQNLIYYLWIMLAVA